MSFMATACSKDRSEVEDSPMARDRMLLANDASPLDRAAVCVKVPLYAGTNPHVKSMIAFLKSHLRDDLFGAYLHGSLATGEEVPYSDFDALVIVRGDAIRNPARLATLARKLRKAQQIMFEFDPLQHHGWFQLTEADLASYNEAYFPHELFAFSKSLLSGQGLEITVKPRDSGAEKRQSFLDVARNFQRNIHSGHALKNMYHLKNSLSLFMLLPALYLQVRDGRGVFKKFSFEAARGDFTGAEWTCMDRVSEIRKAWKYEISPFRRKLLSRPWRIRRRLLRILAPPVPADIRARVTDGMLADMNRLAERMTLKLGMQ